MQTDETSENDISGQMPEPKVEQSSLLLRLTGHNADVHFTNVWINDYNEKKVAVKSRREYSYIFSDELEWEKSHHRWNSKRVEDTKMWEIDLKALFYVACVFINENAEVTIDEQVWREFIALTDS